MVVQTIASNWRQVGESRDFRLAESASSRRPGNHMMYNVGLINAEGLRQR